MAEGTSATTVAAEQADPAKLKDYLDQVIKKADFYIGEERKKIEEYEAVRDKLKPLPEKLTHAIMVPFGSVAYLPGKLVNTNSVTVNYGDHYFVERSVHQTVEIINRRIKLIQEKIKGYEDEKKLVKDRIDMISRLYDSQEFPEIREPYTEEFEKQKRSKRQREKHVVSKEEFDDIMEHLDKLEMLEAQEEGEASDQAVPKERKEIPKKVPETHVVDTQDGMKKMVVDGVEYSIPRGVPEEDFLQLLEHLEQLENEGEDEDEESDGASDGERYSDHDSDEEGGLDSDDYPEPEKREKKEDEEPEPQGGRKRSVRFNLEDQPQTSSGESQSPSATAKPILRNKDYQSPIDHEAIEKSNQRDVKKILPESKEAFPGKVVERNPVQEVVHHDDPQPSTSGEPPVRMSKFKMQRMKR
uniref:Unconventional prefoldin RPB5 interactor n=1 Tax=Steinernema glaseri TaxID=37863 RepID=A0A1I7ZLC2_9BILA